MPKGAITAADLSRLRAIASRYAAVPHEADDIVQDVLLAAIRAQRPCNDPSFLPWAHGAIRNHSRFVARTIARRKAREKAHGELHVGQSRPAKRIPEQLVAELSPALRIVALLANLGLAKAEIAWLLSLGDQAMRQRLHGLHKAVAASGLAMEEEPDRHIEGAPGLARRLLKQSIPRHGDQRFAVRDPDGVAIFFSVAHNSHDDGNS